MQWSVGGRDARTPSGLSADLRRTPGGVRPKNRIRRLAHCTQAYFTAFYRRVNITMAKEKGKVMKGTKVKPKKTTEPTKRLGLARVAYKDQPPATPPEQTSDDDPSEHSDEAEVPPQEIEYQEFVQEAPPPPPPPPPPAAAAAAKDTKKGRSMFTRQEENQITSFLKNRPMLYQTGSTEYLAKTQRAERLEVWKELQLDMPSTTPEVLETWYWSSRTLYGKQLNKATVPLLPGQKPTRAHYLMEAWSFHKPYIRSSKVEEPSPSLTSSRVPIAGPSPAAPVPSPSTTRVSDWDVEPPVDEEEEEESDYVPVRKRARLELPRQREVPPERELAGRINSYVLQSEPADPAQAGRRLIMEGVYQEVLRALPPLVWWEFQEDFMKLVSSYRYRLYTDDRAMPVTATASQQPQQPPQQPQQPQLPQMPQQYQAFQMQPRQQQQQQQQQVMMPSYLQPGFPSS